MPKLASGSPAKCRSPLHQTARTGSKVDHHSKVDGNQLNPGPSAGDLVVIIHGLSATRLVMWPLSRRLGREGFRVKYWSYPSLFGSVQTHGLKLREYLSSDLSGEFRIHIVAHSMGCIVLRAALAEGVLKHLGRIVMLAPPNRGSPIAGVVYRFLGWLIPPTKDLSSDRASYVHRLSEWDGPEVGIIAAKYDILIPVANTMLERQSAHQVVCGTHNSILFSPQVGTKVANFLRTGSFADPIYVPPTN